jgi:peptidoglycan hydrolase-like protein with peptidoglycan-binding domain
LRRALFLFAVVAVVAIASGAAFIFGTRAAPTAAAAGSSVPTSTTAIVRRDLVDRQDFAAVLGFGAATGLANHLAGTVTAEASPGSTVDRGHQLYAVDGRAVYLMFGATPAYRDLHVGVSDGEDIKELKQNLIALGFATTYNLTVDGHFDSYTQAAVERWQKAIGVTTDGNVPFGQVIFEAAAVRVADWKAAVGDQAGPGAPIGDITGVRPTVTMDLDARRQALATVGSAITVTLADGSSVAGHITEVGHVATQPSGGGQATVKVYATLDDPKAGGQVDQAPVQVGLTRGSRKGVLAVPVNALMARPDGTYAVEVDSHGTREQVPVTIGLFAQGMVEISGSGISEGMTVVVPAE